MVQMNSLDLVQMKSLDLGVDEDGKVQIMQSKRSILHLVHLTPYFIVEMFCRARKVLVRLPCPIAGILPRKM